MTQGSVLCSKTEQNFQVTPSQEWRLEDLTKVRSFVFLFTNSGLESQCSYWHPVEGAAFHY